MQARSWAGRASAVIRAPPSSVDRVMATAPPTATSAAPASSGLGRMDGGAGAAIPLVDWVTDLATNHNDNTSAPDTVADKNIADTDNPQAFDSLLQR